MSIVYTRVIEAACSQSLLLSTLSNDRTLVVRILANSIVFVLMSVIFLSASATDISKPSKKLGRPGESHGLWISRLRREQTTPELDFARRVFENEYGVSTKVVEVTKSVEALDSASQDWTSKQVTSKELDIVAVKPGSKGYFAGFSTADHLWALVQCANGDLLADGLHGPPGLGQNLRQFSRILPIDPHKKRVYSRVAKVKILLDRSSKMTLTDCPEGKSRLTYCAEQVSSLIHKKLKNRVEWCALGTLCGSAQELCLYDPKGDHILDLKPLSTNDPALRSAIRKELGAYILARDSGDMTPRCVVVLTSGLAKISGEDLVSLRREIQQGTRFMSSRDHFSLVFVQVGDDKTLDQEWHKLSATQFHAGVVVCKSFAEFKERGLVDIVKDSVLLEPKE